MQKIIEIETKKFSINRQIICDMCNNYLYTDSYEAEKIYAVFWVERGGNIYLEKYVCESCYKEYFSDKKTIPFNESPKPFQRALIRDLKRNWYGVIVSLNSVDDFKLLQENPHLLEVLGEKF
ncbi:hypothetical protein V4D30_01150 [Thermodesulfovibrio sp. 3907-1M]|uniref:Uncharacterized protein n=1 Tax=Thermodesulfovibrio autotrophicus TaxID=3118333 RepID=A0AAU8GWV2_9BACT